MKRAILIATGTVGGLGAVLAITPPTFTSTESSSMALPGAAVDPASTASTPAATQSATPTMSATAAATAKATPSKSAATNNSQSQTSAATPTKVAAAPAAKLVSGTFTGDSVDVRYGFVQVKITVENGKITDAQAVTAPSGRNDRWTQMSVPVLRQRTLAAQSANISGVSGASFTSYGWYTSLASALAKAGM
ncbi:FMN-binding domain-containing protein [Candidatus Planktophila lacus]|uniref:FMN-binding protein n=1 Tax=Candidatus Planktophila lacus TaxID=1884913 RepID=UPI000BACD200|nr:FMN-binding protein [Candidatus Planktophila lacus]ASY24530.1 FMN-binding domain-containing protein [Candidatus Planktophila lacus]